MSFPLGDVLAGTGLVCYAGIVLKIVRQSKNCVRIQLPSAYLVGGLAVVLFSAWVLAKNGLSSSHWGGWFCLLVGIALLTTQLYFEFDRKAGVLRMYRSVFYIATLETVPLFHLRAAVVRRQGPEGKGSVSHLRQSVFPRRIAGYFVQLFCGVLCPLRPNNSGCRSLRFVCCVDRRRGKPVVIARSNRCAKMVTLAHEIATVADIPFEYDGAPEIQYDHRPQ